MSDESYDQPAIEMHTEGSSTTWGQYILDLLEAKTKMTKDIASILEEIIKMEVSLAYWHIKEEYLGILEESKKKMTKESLSVVKPLGDKK